MIFFVISWQAPPNHDIGAITRHEAFESALATACEVKGEVWAQGEAGSMSRILDRRAVEHVRASANPTAIGAA
jgi:hypothetical protein